MRAVRPKVRGRLSSFWEVFREVRAAEQCPPHSICPDLLPAHSYPPLFFPLCFSECGFVSRWEKIPTTHKSPPDIIPGPSAPWNDAECHQQADELLPTIRPASERTRGSDRECSILWATLLQAADERCECPALLAQLPV